MIISNSLTLDKSGKPDPILFTFPIETYDEANPPHLKIKVKADQEALLHESVEVLLNGLTLGLMQADFPLAKWQLSESGQNSLIVRLMGEMDYKENITYEPLIIDSIELITQGDS